MTSSSINLPANSVSCCSSVVGLSVHAIGLNAIGSAASSFSRDVIRALAAKHGFDADAAISEFVPERVPVHRVDPKRKLQGPRLAKKPAKPSMVLPWVGVVRDGCCHGLRYNHGLFTQCANVRVSNTPDKPFGEYCVTCQKQSATSSSGKPTFGDVCDRMLVDAMDFRDPKGKSPLPYANVMDKLGLSRDSAQTESNALYGCDIPEDQFVSKSSSRGRPKSSMTSSSNSDDGDTKRGRGRPAKKLKLTQTQVGDDLIASLVADATPSAGLQIQIPVSPTSSSNLDERLKAAADEAKRAAKDAEKAEKDVARADREEEKRLAKEARDAEKAEAKALRDEEKRVAKEARDAEKAIKDAEKAAKDAEKAARAVIKQQSRALKDAEKAAKEENAAKEKASEPQGPVPFTHDDVKYLKHEAGLYDPITGDLVGVWDDITCTIGPVPDDSDDEECDE